MLSVVARYAIMRQKPDKNSPIVYKIPFGAMVSTMARKLEGNIKVSYRETNRAGGYYSGYVSAKALTRDIVEDYSGLFYYNAKDVRIPCTGKYNGKKVIGYVYPGQYVKMYAKVGQWCLTDKGWSMFDWFSKDRDIISMDVINNLVYGVLTQAVHDYCCDVRRLKTHRYKTLEDYCEICNDLEKIVVWFKGKKRVIKGDYVTVRERMNDLNEKIGIDSTWIGRKMRARDCLYERNLARKVKEKDE